MTDSSNDRENLWNESETPTKWQLKTLTLGSPVPMTQDAMRQDTDTDGRKELSASELPGNGNHMAATV